jgi:DNA-binding LacI/PurR family transcriptional regulator
MLTSVKQPRFEIACHAATILIDQISKRGDSAALPVKEIIKPSLVMGNSTAWIS